MSTMDVAGRSSCTETCLLKAQQTPASVDQPAVRGADLVEGDAPTKGPGGPTATRETSSPQEEARAADGEAASRRGGEKGEKSEGKREDEGNGEEGSIRDSSSEGRTTAVSACSPHG